MARELYIFKSVLPNYDNNTHYYFTDALAYFDYLTQNYYHIFLPLDNSRDNTNVIKVSASAFDFDYNEATYVIDCEIRPSIAGAPRKLLYWKCFYINTSTLQSGFVRMTLSVDYWGTYIYKANLSNYQITRCNRNIGEGLYDKPKITSSLPVQFIADGTISESDITIVFKASVIIYKEEGFNDYINTIEYYAMTLSDIRTKVGNMSAGNLSNEMDGITLASMYISSIFATAGSSEWDNLEAQVLEIYALPSAWVDMTSVSMSFKIKSMFNPMSILTDSDFKTIYNKTRFKYKTFTIPQDSVNRRYRVGTFKNGLWLDLKTETNYYAIHHMISNGGINITMDNGIEQIDISNEFKIPVLAKGYGSDISENLGIMGKFLSKLCNIGMKLTTPLTAPSGLFSIPELIASFQSSIAPTTNEGSGNAFTTFANSLTATAIANRQLNSPFGYFQVASIDDEDAKARKTGAMFYICDMDLPTIATHTLLGSGTDTRTYAVVNCEVDGVPTEARNTIRNKLLAGIYYVVV